MSWEAWSFVVLGAVLLGGFAWYERSRPPSQVVALVAALAALAVAGRLAFAAIPNVVATTDIVLFSGYAIGPAPGFAVGALAGLVSNFWLGQGPVDPVADGRVGAVWRLRGAPCPARRPDRAGRPRRRLRVRRGRLRGADELLADGELRRRAVARALRGAGDAGDPLRRRPRDRERHPGADRGPGDAADAGPLQGAIRVEAPGARAEKAVAGPGSAAAASRRSLLAALALGAVAAPPAKAAGRAEGLALAGGVPRTPTAGSALRLALTRASRSPAGRCSAWRRPGAIRWICARRGSTPVDFLRRNSARIGSSGDLAKTILALEGAGVNPRHFAGRNLVGQLRRRRRSNGSFEGWPNATAFAVLALRASGATGPAWRVRCAGCGGVQNRDGGWGVVPGGPSDADSTGAVLQAVSGRRSVRRAIRVPPPRPGRRGRLRLGGSGVGQLPVHRLGGPGDAGRRGPAAADPRGRPRRARLPLRTPNRQRPLPLLEAKRPDPDLGNSPSPGPALRKDLPNRPGTQSPPLSQAGTEYRPLRELRGNGALLASGAASPAGAATVPDSASRKGGDGAPSRRTQRERASPANGDREATRASRAAGRGPSPPQPRRPNPRRSAASKRRRRPTPRRRRASPPRWPWPWQPPARPRLCGGSCAAATGRRPIRSTPWTWRPRSGRRRTHKAFAPEPIPREEHRPAPRPRPLGAQPPPHRPLALSRRRPGGAWAAEVRRRARGRVEARSCPDPGRRLLRAQRRPNPGRGGPARHRRRLLHRPAGGPRPGAGGLLADSRLPALRRGPRGARSRRGGALRRPAPPRRPAPGAAQPPERPPASATVTYLD